MTRSQRRREIAIEIAKASFVNQDDLQREDAAGCYCCLAVFPVERITKYDGETACCPECGTDAVVPSSVATPEQLKEARAYWFDGAA